MPTTINGIGTRYVGKQNASARVGVCQSCGRNTQLESYDTRLWFVVIFIPVIPLGRKRILDECQACHRHYAADQEQFAISQQLAQSDARDQYASDSTPESALRSHAQLLGLHAHQEAEAFRTEVLESHAGNAMLVAGLADQLDEMGQYDAATPLYEQAHQLDPALPEAKLGLALRRLNSGQLDEARALAAHLEQPGAGQLYPLGLLDHLAQAYQKQGQHQEVVQLATVLLRELPALAEHQPFRRFVAKSEAKLPFTEHILPPSEASWRALFDPRSTAFSKGQRLAAYAAIVVGVTLLGLAGLNEYRRRHRSIIIFNEFGAQTQLAVDGVPIDIGQPRTTLSLAEGVHHVQITGAIDETYDFPMDAEYFARWTSSPVWVINVGGAAPLISQTVYYAEHPRPSETTLLSGKPHWHAAHIDYLEQEPPDSIEVGSENNEVTKTRFATIAETPESIFQAILSDDDPAPAYSYAESRLVINPDDGVLLRNYFASAFEKQPERVKQFFEKHFDQRPTRVAWHRCLQECYPSAADKRELAKRYDTLLSTSPNDAAALYLRGRLCSTSAETVTWSDRSIAADPQLPWPWMAKAWHAGCRGDWEESRELAAKAVEFGAKDDAEPLLFTALIATKNFTEAEGLFRERLSSASINESHRALLMLMMTLCAQGKSSQAISAADDWIGQLSAHLPANEVERFRGEMLGLSEYMSRDLPALGERVSAGAVSPQLRLQYWLASKQPEKVLKDAEVEPLAAEGWGAVAMSLSFELAVQPDLASEWRQKAAARLAQGDFEEVTAGAILMADKPPRTKPFMELGLDPAQKALLAALVAVRFPDQKAEFVEIARKLNVLPEGYSALIEQVFGL